MATDAPTEPTEPTVLAVYKSPRHDLMCLYLPAAHTSDDSAERADLSVIPAELLTRFGAPVFALTLELWPTRKLAQADAKTVLAAIDTQGFYLQMPPKVTLPATPDAQNVHG